MSQLLEKLKSTLDGLQTRIASLQADRDVLSEALHALAGNYGKNGEIIAVDVSQQVVFVNDDGQYMSRDYGVTTNELTKAARLMPGVVTDKAFPGFKRRRVLMTTVTTVEILGDDISG